MDDNWLQVQSCLLVKLEDTHLVNCVCTFEHGGQGALLLVQGLQVLEAHITH